MESLTLFEIDHLLSPCDSSPTECDGMTQLCHTLLYHADIPHIVKCGVCRYGSNLLPLHFWIDLTEQLQSYRVDYRLQMWFGKSNKIPHGIFLPEKFHLVEYEGIRLDLEPLPPVIFHALQIGISEIDSLPPKAMKKAALINSR